MPPCRISVAMATCEGGRFITAQLESIASQTRPPDELIICDDDSADDTLARIEAFRADAPFAVRIERNPKRLGSTANFERSVSLCSGEIILLADQDDVWLPEKIATLTDLLESQRDVGVVFSNGVVVDESLTPLGYDLWRALFFGPTDQARVRRGDAPAVFARRVVAAGTTLAFRSRFAPLLHPFPDLPSTHDAWIAFMISAVARCEIVEAPLIQYRLHGANQIGLRRFNLRDQYRQAKRQIAEGTFAREATFFELARTRLMASETQFPARGNTNKVIEEKIAHSQTRCAIPRSLSARIPIVASELLRGRYHRYAYGLGSVAQDLFLR